MEDAGALIRFGEWLAGLAGAPEAAAWITAAAVMALPFVLLALTLRLLALARSRLGQESVLGEFIGSSRIPIALLAAIAALLVNVGNLIPPSRISLQHWLDVALVVTANVAFFWIALRCLSALEDRFMRKARADGGLRSELLHEEISVGTIRKAALIGRLAVLLALGMVLLNALGVSVASILAVGGFGGVVVGIAARDFLANAFSGLRIFISRPFDLGDWINCREKDVEGVVEEIGWQNIKVRTFDKRPVFLPNSVVATSVVENAQQMSGRRVFEYFGLRYEDIGRVEVILDRLREMLDAHPDVKQDEVKLVAFDKYGDSTLDCFIYCITSRTVWVEYHKMKSELLLTVAEIVKQAGADFAFPTMTMVGAAGGDGKPPADLPPQ